MAKRRTSSSMAEVARAAGVSPATVSRVLAGQRRHIAPETRRRVLAAAARLDYSPDVLARSLVTRRAPLIAALVHDISDPYFGEIARGIESVAGERDHVVMVCNWLGDPQRLLRYLRLLRAMRVRGVVFCGSGLAADAPHHEEVVRQIGLLRRDGIRLVALAPQPVAMPAVMVDNRNAAAAATAHLLAHGHRRIGHLAGPPLLLTARERQEGYRLALRRAGLRPEPGWIESTGFRLTEGYEATRRLLARVPDLTAIFAANDQAAIGAVAAAEDLGRPVPATLSVVGIGNVPVLPYLRPALTTVSVPTFSLGQEGARLVFVRGAPEPRGAARRTDPRRPLAAVRFLPVELVVRQSVAAPPAVHADHVLRSR